MATPTLLAVRTFGEADQARFAALSGDVNPLHMDAVAARKTQAGAPAVHGVNAMLWALDRLLADRPGSLATISARFERFVVIGTEVELHTVDRRGAVRLELRTAGRRLSLVDVGFGEPEAGPPKIDAEGACDLPPVPVELSFAQASEASGAFRLPAADPSADYPALAAALGADRVRALAGLSALVGMLVPGLHSILSSIIAEFAPGDGAGDVLTYRTASGNDAYSLITLEARHPGLTAEVEAFLRPPPVRQPAFADLRAVVAPGAYAHVDALIVGGSRGLGEVVAKLIAAGGGRVCITYAAGRDDAERLAAELEAGGAAPCPVRRFDAREPVAPQLADLPFRPTQVYWFATPRIFRQRFAFFSPALLEDYLAVYCTAFEAVCQAFAGAAPVRVYNPSSIAVEERPRDLTEYAMAKAAAEMLCQDIDRDLPGVSVLSTRLPRLDTDQTATVTRVDAESVTDVMGDIVRRMSSEAGA